MNVHDRALEILEEGGWTRRQYTGPDGSHCTMGCYRKALIEQFRRQNETADQFNTNLREAYLEFLTALYGGDYAPTDTDTLVASIGYWNDAKAKDPAEVREVMKKASENHELGESR